MGPGHLIGREFAQVALAIASILMLATLPHWWRRPIRRLEHPPPWFPYPGAFRGVRRALGVATALCVLGALVIALPAGSPIGVILAYVTIGVLALFYTIWFFNWPKGLVPLYLRREQGTIEEWLRRPRLAERTVRFALRWGLAVAALSVVMLTAYVPGRPPALIIGSLASAVAAYWIGSQIGNLIFRKPEGLAASDE